MSVFQLALSLERKTAAQRRIIAAKRAPMQGRMDEIRQHVQALEAEFTHLDDQAEAATRDEQAAIDMLRRRWLRTQSWLRAQASSQIMRSRGLECFSHRVSDSDPAMLRIMGLGEQECYTVRLSELPSLDCPQVQIYPTGAGLRQRWHGECFMAIQGLPKIKSQPQLTAEEALEAILDLIDDHLTANTPS